MPSRFVKGVYAGDVEIVHPITGEIKTLHVWMNPETHKLVALDHWELDARHNYAVDPHDADVGILFDNTFTGLPR